MKNKSGEKRELLFVFLSTILNCQNQKEQLKSAVLVVDATSLHLSVQIK